MRPELFAMLLVFGTGLADAAVRQPDIMTIPTVTTYEFANLQHFNRVQLIHDTVMGGRSDGMVSRLPDATGLHFSGNLSLANNGGFASVEFRLAQPLPEQAFQQLLLQIAGDQRQYQLRLKTPFIPGGVAYVANFVAHPDRQLIRFAPNDFTGQFRGQRLRNMPALHFKDVTHFSIMLADKTPGTFAISLYSLTFSPLQDI